MVERASGRALTFRVPDRTRETLVTRLVQEFIQPGTVILSDKFSPYFNLNDISYTHLMVNHSENFVDPYTGAHTNTIEGLWNAVKKKLKRMCGTFKHQLPSYLDEFNWQRVYPGERFEMMLQHIAELYPAGVSYNKNGSFRNHQIKQKSMINLYAAFIVSDIYQK